MPAIPFNTGQASGLDQLAGAQPLVANQLVDVSGSLRSRPGISAWSMFPSAIPDASPVDLMVPWGDVLVYVTRDRYIWADYTAGPLVSALSDVAIATSGLEGATRPVGLALNSRVVLIGGGVPQKWEGATVSERLGGSPPTGTHIVNVNGRLVINNADQSGRFQWSGLGEAVGHESWDALDFAEAEAKGDPLRALAENTNELFPFGTQTLQVYSPDPYFGFATGRAINLGLLAPYSVVNFDDTFAFLDRDRRFIVTDGRGFSDETSVISRAIESDLLALTTVSDCWGFRMRLDRFDAGVWFFPTDGKGYIWNRRGNQWSEWRAFGATGWQAATITSAVSWPEKNLVLVGLSTGQIAKLDTSAHTDLGATLKLELVSGRVNHGTEARKLSKAARFVFKRGQTAQSGTEPMVNISWRDDLGAYRTPVTRGLGLAGDYNPVIELRSTGVYRGRQWKIEFTADAELTFVGADEEIQVLAA